tara:strand:- start:280 stop:2868 length:2589 start_codon:yes stop_codon:yes gene_type:complete
MPAAPILLSAALASAGSAVSVTAGSLAFAGFMTMAKTFVISAALGFVASALSPKAKTPSVTQGGFVRNNLGSVLDHAIIYGETKVGGAVFYASTSNNDTILHRMLAIAGHEVNSYESFFLNDEQLTLDGNGLCTAPDRFAGKVFIQAKTGTDNQTAVDLHGFGASVSLPEGSDEWTQNHRAKGIAYIYSALKFDAAAFPNGTPVLTAIVKGRKVFDPRNSSTAWSANAALCIRDYLASDFGLGCNADEIDDVYFADAANDCDQNVALDAGGTQKRYTANGSFTSAVTPNDAITQMLTSCGGMFWYSQGKFGIKAASWDAPSLSYDENDLIEPIEIVSRHSRRDQINQMRGTFRGPETNYQQTDFPVISSDVFLSQDGGIASVTDMPLPFTDTSPMAQRIAKMALYRQREQIQVSATMGLSGFKAKIGDIIQITNARMGWANKAFEVVDWSFSLGSDNAFQCSMSLLEISESVFAWDADEQTFSQNNTELLSAFSVPDVGLSISSELRKTKQSIVGVLNAVVTCATPTRLSAVELQFKLSSEADTAYRTFSTGPLGNHEVLGLIDGGVYDFRARGISTIGLAGSYVTISNQTFTPFAAPPSNVAGFESSVSAGTAIFKWNPVADLDASHYELRQQTSTSGATWGASSVLIEKIAHPTSSVAVVARSGTFLIKAVDRSGIYSDAAASNVILATELPPLGTTETLAQNPGFSGSKTNLQVVSNELLMTSFASAGSSGVYLFSTHIDVGQTRTATVNVDLTETRHHSAATSGSVNWDDISSSFNWDDWPGNFDDFTDEDAAFNDYSVDFYVRATTDDPAGSPTYGNWVPATGGQIVARGFQFKAEVANVSNKVSPAISALAAKVSY